MLKPSLFDRSSVGGNQVSWNVISLPPEILQRRLVEQFVQVLSTTQQLELNHLDSLKSRVADVDSKLHKVDIVKDQDLFINYNIRPFVLPDDLKFEPSPIHYDTVTLFFI